MGDGISSHQVEFCLERFPFMVSASTDSSLQTYATSGDVEMIHPRAWEHPNTGTKDGIKGPCFAKFVPSHKPRQEVVRP